MDIAADAEELSLRLLLIDPNLGQKCPQKTFSKVLQSLHISSFLIKCILTQQKFTTLKVSFLKLISLVCRINQKHVFALTLMRLGVYAGTQGSERSFH